jgi:hypothetical protein
MGPGESATTERDEGAAGVEKRSAMPPGGRVDPLAGTAVLTFGIACCALAMAVVLAVAAGAMM